MNLNEAFEQYRCAPTEDHAEILYPLLKERVTRVIGKLTQSEPDEDLVVTITSDVFMDLEKYKDQGHRFSTWAERVIRRDCLDYFRTRDRNKEESLEGLSFTDANSLYTQESAERNVLLAELYQQLDGDEKPLFSGKLEGLNGLELAENLEVTRHAVELRWARLKIKLREIVTVSNA